MNDSSLLRGDSGCPFTTPNRGPWYSFLHVFGYFFKCKGDPRTEKDQVSGLLEESVVQEVTATSHKHKDQVAPSHSHQR